MFFANDGVEDAVLFRFVVPKGSRQTIDLSRPEGNEKRNAPLAFFKKFVSEKKAKSFQRGNVRHQQEILLRRGVKGRVVSRTYATLGTGVKRRVEVLDIELFDESDALPAKLEPRT